MNKKLQKVVTWIMLIVIIAFFVASLVWGMY